MPRVSSFRVIADLPQKLEPLRELANNLWWTWNHDAKSLFSRISKERSAKTKLNPIDLINSLSSEEISALQNDSGFLNQLSEVYSHFTSYCDSRSWWKNHAANTAKETIAYFSLEFGIHETLPIYSGGLGVLAGDHLKASSDLGLPLVGVGLLYYEGYFSQYLNADGWQQELYPQIDPNRLPIEAVTDATGNPVRVEIPVAETIVHFRAWRAKVGLIDLYLLDTNLEENQPQDRTITARLYGGDLHMRIKQEIVLAIGGLRVLAAAGITPHVTHMNEGHSAFLSLEHIRRYMLSHGMNFEQALLAARAHNHFTTHTPVPAGNDVFPPELIVQYFTSLSNELEIPLDSLLALGRIDESNPNEAFSMTVLALKTSQGANGVSELHGHVSRKLWHDLWPKLPLNETPIGAVTNGVHVSTWASRDIAELYERYIGADWSESVANPEQWRAISQISDEELWQVRCTNRTQLIAACRRLIKGQLIRRGAGRLETEHAGHGLNPDVLTIGFARRFASYKRASLLLHDIERLIRLASNTERPVQFIFAGKAHPADAIGKEIIAKIIHALHRPELINRFFFLEDYDMGIASLLVQGADVWLNNPRRPLEACGTSGMKVAVNGGLNFSVLDGWWCEAFDGANGWSIGQGEEYDSTDYQDQVESRSIYDLLEREIIPLFYERTEADIPHEWLRVVRHSMRTITPQFSAARMVADYARLHYIPRITEHASDIGTVQDSAAQLSRLRKHWESVKIVDVHCPEQAYFPLGGGIPISVTVETGTFSAEEVAIEVQFGTVDATKQIQHSKTVRLKSTDQSSGKATFKGTLSAERAGSFGFSVRAIPVFVGAPTATIPSLITWWE